MPIINKMVLCTSKFIKMVDLMLSVCTTKKQTKQRDIRKTWEVLDMPSTLILVMVSQVFAYFQTHQILQLSVYQLYLNKAVF